MKKIKEFFDKKKADIHFKQAGQGRRLGTAEEAAQQPQKVLPPKVRQRESSSSSSDRPKDMTPAALAAERRLQARNQPVKRPTTTAGDQFPTSSSASSVSAQSASAASQNAPTRPQERVADVRVICPVTGERLAPSEMHEHMTRVLQQKHDEAPLDISAKMVHTLCTAREAREACITVLTKYLENIIEHPDEEKYRKIRTTNKAFQNKVAPVLGAVQFLHAVGFEQVQQDEDTFLILPQDKVNIEALTMAKDVITNTKPLKHTLDRDLHVLRPQAGKQPHRMTVPDSFFEVTVDDVRMQHAHLAAASEASSTLMTSAMRQAAKEKGKRVYKYCLVRIRLPDGLVLQGVFYARESLKTLFSFVKDTLEMEDAGFTLHAPSTSAAASTGSRMKLEDSPKTTLYDAGLVPSAVVTFSWEHPQDMEGVPVLKHQFMQAVEPL